MVEAGRLFEAHRAWAREVARSFAARRGICGFDCDALESEAEIGAWDAATRFDPTHGASFKTFASRRILGHLRDSHYRQPYMRRERRYGVRVTTLKPQDPNDPNDLAAQFIDPDSDAGFRGLEAREEVERVLLALEPAHRTLLRQRYFEGLTWVEIAAHLGCTESRACQIHSEALSACRALLKALDGAHRLRRFSGRRIEVESVVPKVRRECIKSALQTRRVARETARAERAAKKVAEQEAAAKLKAERAAQKLADQEAAAAERAAQKEAERIERRKKLADQETATKAAQLAAVAPPMDGAHTLDLRMQEVLRLTFEQAFTVRQIAEHFSLPFKKAQKLCTRAVILARRAAESKPA